MPEFLIVTPMYNAEATIAETIASVRRQTICDWRMVVMDDGSADRSVEVATLAADSDSRIEIVENGRVAHIGTLRNRALHRNHAEYAVCLDADDVWEPEFLNAQRFLAQETGAAVVHCAARHIVEGKSVSVAPRYRGPRYCGPPSMLGYLCPRNPIYSPSVLLRYETIMGERGFSEHPDHFSVLDTDLWLRLAPRYAFAYNDAKLLNYRISSASLSGNPENRLRNVRGEIIALNDCLAANSDLPVELLRKLRGRLGRCQAAYARLLMDEEPPNLKLSQELLRSSLANGYLDWRQLPFQLFAQCSPRLQYRLHRFVRRLRGKPYRQQQVDNATVY